MAISRLLSGAVAGFIATAPMTAAMEAMHHLLPWWQRYPLPPDQITGRFTRAIGLRKQVDRHEHKALTMLSHFGYGAAAGALYAPLAASVRPRPVIGGILYGLLVWLVSYLGLLPALHALPPATKHPRRRTALMILAHVVYGGALGLLAHRFAGRDAPAALEEQQARAMGS